MSGAAPPVLTFSPSADARLVEVLTWLRRQSADQELLAVSPTLEAGRELFVRAVRSLGLGAALGWRRTTPRLLAHDLAIPALTQQGRAPVGHIGFEALVTRVVHDLRSEGALPRYAEIAGTPGFTRALSATVQELRLHALAGEDVSTVSPELGAVLDRFARLLEKEGLADEADVLTVAAQLATDPDFEHPLIAIPLVLIDVPVRWQREAVLLAQLLRRSPDALIALPEGDYAARRRIESALSEPARPEWSTDKTKSTSRPPAGTPAELRNSLARLQQYLFEDQSPAPEEPDDSLCVLSAPGKERECVEITRKILSFAASGVPFDRMAILLRTPAEYRARLEEALAKGRVPAYWAVGVRRPDAAGRAFVALLRCKADGFSARRFAESLSLGQVPDANVNGAPPNAPSESERWAPPDDDGREQLSSTASEAVAKDEDRRTQVQDSAPQGASTESRRGIAAAAGEVAAEPIPSSEDEPVQDGTLRAPRGWERLIVEASVVGGLDRWRRRLDGLGEERKIALRHVMAEEDAPESTTARLEKEIRDLDHLQSYALPLLEDLDSLPTGADWGTWLDALSGLATRGLRRPQRILQLLAELAPLRPVGPVDLAEVLRVLSQHLLELSRAPEGTRYGKVFVGDAEAGRARSFDVVFIPGLGERLFPRKIQEDPLLLDLDRERLGAELASNESRIQEERLALRLAVGAARRACVLSYPRMDTDLGRPHVPSFYALEALRAAEGKLPLFEDLGRRAGAVTEARIGWPAPKSPGDAIDDAEYDLAKLDEINRRKAENRTGSARYLLNASPHLARALRGRAARWWVPTWTAADGFVKAGGTAREALIAYLPSARPTSVSSLQNYAVCPYKYYLSTVYQLPTHQRPEPLEALDPLQRGSLFHEMQFASLSRLRENGMLPVDPQNLANALTCLDEVVQEVAAAYEDRLAPAIPRVWATEIDAIGADLHRWLRQMSTDISGFIPWRFELAFGVPWKDPQDPNSSRDPVELEELGIRLRGAIDLVEQRERDGRLRITDHKTGKAWAGDRSIVYGGEVLQPVLYPLIAEKLFPDLPVHSGRLYYCTSEGEFKIHEVPLNARARQTAKAVIETVRSAGEGGFLPAYPKAGACEWCEYLPICGPWEEMRTGRKPDIKSLESLRELK